MSIDMQRREGIVYSRPRAIKGNCLDCCGSAKEVKLCDIQKCHFWPYRFGSAVAKFVAKREKEMNRYVTNEEIAEFRLNSKKKKDEVEEGSE
jgi:hypothetical protein